MKIALLGYGKMGQTIEKIALEKGHEIVLKIGIDNLADFIENNIRQADVAIEFSQPDAAFENLSKCMEWNIPVVCGTTGWLEKLDIIKEKCLAENNTFLFASNFSLGVNLFFELNSKLAAMMNKFSSYIPVMEEIHHTQKLDYPSGTAITLAEGIIENMDSKSKWVGALNENSKVVNNDEILINALREPNVPGTHTITYHSDVDSISITHEAKSRDGFALGAVLAAEFIKDKKGIFSMKNVLGLE